jgi:hypothetical protein
VTDELFLTRIRLLKRLGWLALCGAIAFVVALLLGGSELGRYQPLALVGGLALVPGLFYLVLMTIWHWKGRYRGRHSDLWGALLVIETSGWFKVIYLFRHIIPDAKHSGRYEHERP